MTNGVGFLLVEPITPCLIWENKAAPWSGFYSKVEQCHQQNYGDWCYHALEVPFVIVVLEKLVRWQDE